jgi:predicted amidohydrolase
MQDLKITLVQSNLYWENIDENLKMFSQKISSIKEKADLIVLPEMFSTGFTMNNKPLAEKMNEKTFQWMQKLAKEKNCVLTGSIIIEENSNYFNRLIWMRTDGTFETYDKRHLFRYANEQDHYTAGNKKLIVELNGWKICPQICYDLRFPVWIRNRNKEYDILIFSANWPERRNYPREALLVARAIENQSYVIGVNRVGKDGGGINHSGDSVAINPQGEIICRAKPNEEIAMTVTLSYSELEEWRKKFPVWMDADRFTIQ